MDDPVFVGRTQALGQLQSQTYNLLLWERPLRQSVIQGHTGDVFHHQKVCPPLGVKVMDGRDVGMVQLGECQGFFVKPPAGGFVAEGSRREHLDGYVAVEVFIVGTENLTHTSGADLLNDAVMTQYVSDKRVSADYLFRHRRRRSFSLSHRGKS